MTVESKCQVDWLAVAMSLAGGDVERPPACPERSSFLIEMRLSSAGSVVAFEVAVCGRHQRELRISPYYVDSTRHG